MCHNAALIVRMAPLHGSALLRNMPAFSDSFIACMCCFLHLYSRSDYVHLHNLTMHHAIRMLIRCPIFLFFYTEIMTRNEGARQGMVAASEEVLLTCMNFFGIVISPLICALRLCVSANSGVFRVTLYALSLNSPLVHLTLFNQLRTLAFMCMCLPAASTSCALHALVRCLQTVSS